MIVLPSKTKLLYLTNIQAKAVAEDPKSIELMMQSFYGANPKPSLVINLAQSWGFYNSTTLTPESAMEGEWCKGIGHNSTPFETMKDDDLAMLRIKEFMKNIILPLAEKTNAIIFCSAIEKDCVLTENLMDVLRMESSSYDKGNLPFTIVRYMNQTEVLYMKENVNHEKLVWPQIMKQSKNWERRHTEFLQNFYDKSGEIQKLKKEGDKELNAEELSEKVQKLKWWRGHDLDFSKGHLIVVEGVDVVNKKKDHAPSAILCNSIMRHIGHDVPSLVFKIGATP